MHPLKFSYHQPPQEGGLPMTPRPRTTVTAALSLLVLVLFGLPAYAQVAKQGNDTLSSLAFQSDRIAPSQPVDAIESVGSAVASATQSAWAAFRLAAPVEWRAAVDKRTGRVSFAEGGKIAWIPGRGNSLTASDLALVLPPGAKKVDLSAMESIARGYLPKVAGLLGVDPKSLVLNAGRSGQPAGHVWFVDFDVLAGGVPIEGARVLVRVSN